MRVSVYAPRFRFRDTLRAGPFPFESHDFYWHAIGSDFFTSRHTPDGARVWDTYYPLWESLAFSYYDIYAWPGWPDFSSTRRGAFHSVVVGRGRSDFFLVEPDGWPYGRVLTAQGASGRSGWGTLVTEDAAGDHYALYYNSFNVGDAHAEESDCIAGWSGIDSMKWVWKAADLYAAGAFNDELYDTFAGIAIPPSGGGAVIAFSNMNQLSGFDAATGALLWTVSLASGTGGYTWEGYQQIAFTPDGVLHVGTAVGASVDERAAYIRVGWPNGFNNAPTVQGTYEWDPDRWQGILSVVALADNSVVLYGTEGANYTPVLRRFSPGSVIQPAYSVSHDGLWDGGYDRALANGGHVLFPLSGQIRRANALTGEIEEAGTEFPLVCQFSSPTSTYLNIGLALVQPGTVSPLTHVLAVDWERGARALTMDDGAVVWMDESVYPATSFIKQVIGLRDGGFIVIQTYPTFVIRRHAVDRSIVWEYANDDFVDLVGYYGQATIDYDSRGEDQLYFGTYKQEEGSEPGTHVCAVGTLDIATGDELWVVEVDVPELPAQSWWQGLHVTGSRAGITNDNGSVYGAIGYTVFALNAVTGEHRGTVQATYADDSPARVNFACMRTGGAVGSMFAVHDCPYDPVEERWEYRFSYFTWSGNQLQQLNRVTRFGSVPRPAGMISQWSWFTTGVKVDGLVILGGFTDDTKAHHPLLAVTDWGQDLEWEERFDTDAVSWGVTSVTALQENLGGRVFVGVGTADEVQEPIRQYALLTGEQLPDLTEDGVSEPNMLLLALIRERE